MARDGVAQALRHQGGFPRLGLRHAARTQDPESDLSSRRKGLGRLCMTKLLDVLADQSVEELWLEVRNDNIAARQLYLSMGARESGRRRRYYPDGTDAILMTYSIGATDSFGPGEICSGG